MIYHRGTVLFLQGEQAAVQITLTEGELPVAITGENALNLLCENSVNAEKGDTVRIQAAKPQVFYTSVFVYLLPLVFALTLLIALWQVGKTAAVLGFFGGLLLGYLVGMGYERLLKKRREYSPRIVEIISKGVLPGEDVSCKESCIFQKKD